MRFVSNVDESWQEKRREVLSEYFIYRAASSSSMRKGDAFFVKQQQEG
jgi:hypothetical protein